MDFNEVITFDGGINTDDTPQAVPKGDYRDFSYCRLGYNAGNAFAVTTSDGTLVIPNTNPDAPGIEDQIIGATPWLKRNAIVYFVYRADLNHQIWVYNIDSQTHELVLEDAVLNFDRNWPIYHANVIEDILKWTDGRWDDQMYLDDGTRLFNPPYQLNLQKALDGYYTVVDLQVLDAIKWPLDPPFVSYITDTTRNDNKLRKKLFRFMIQPIYENGEIGVWSMYSNLPLPLESELITGTNFLGLNNSNAINITFNTGPQIVRKIRVAVQQYDQDLSGSIPPFGIFLELDKEIDVIGNNQLYTYTYYGDTATKPAVDAYKNYDRLPITSYCQEYLPTNQLVYTNFREGYDKIDIVTSPPGSVLATNANYELREISWIPYSKVEYTTLFPAITGSTGNISQIAAYWDWTLRFPFEAGIVFWAQGPSEDPVSLSYQISGEDIRLALLQPTIVLSNVYILTTIGDSFMDQLGWPNGSVVLSGGLYQYQFTTQADNTNPTGGLVRSTRQTQATPSLKVGATHQFGIVYGDRAYRDGTVLTSDNMNVFVPWFYDIDRNDFDDEENPFVVQPRINLFHQPPMWADRYWIVAKPATEILSFGHYVIGAAGFYNEGIVLENQTDNRYKVEIDNYYQTRNAGAQIQHQIQKGDRVRFIRRRPGNNAIDAGYVDYLPYLELEVLEYVPGGGSADNGFPNRDVIYVSLFNPTAIENDFTLSQGNLFGQLIEIYTPRPFVDSNGELFINTWQDVTEAIPILNPHTDERVHGINYNDYQIYYATPPGGAPGSYSPYISGDVSGLVVGFGVEGWQGQFYDNNVFTGENSFTISSAVYEPAFNRTRLGIPDLGPGNPNITVFITRDRAQEWDTVNNELLLNAILNLSYGDVYVKVRNYRTGLEDPDSRVYYYYIEDPHYSDYWLSDIHQVGRLRIQDPDAKTTHRKAASIHSGAYVVGTEVNGLSSFALDNSNIQDMNPIYGEVVRTYMSGREGKTLKCLQPKKENSIYIQYYPNEVGSDSTVRVSNTTFASWFDYKSLFGCSNSGAAAVLPNGATMYFDNRAGVFVYSGANGQIIASEIDPDSKADYKFRTRTKALAAAYNSSSNPYVRTYVNELVGEVGFAFRFDSPYTGTASGRFSVPFPDQEAWTTGTFDDISYLYGKFIIIVHENGAVYSGVVNFIGVQDTGPEYSIFSLDTGGPAASEYEIPAYYYTTSDLNYEHVVFDYVNMRWRSTYDYNFLQFCNLGQTLVGWGVNNQLYLHNQLNQWNFHGDPFIQKVSFVSNEEPLRLKRYQDITLVSDDLFSITAQSEPNRSYPLGMKTTMPTNLISTYEGYGKVNYRKNLYDPRYFNSNNISASSYNPPDQPINGWELDFDQSSIVAETITIIQPSDGQIFTGVVTYANYDPLTDRTLIRLTNPANLEPVEPSTNGVEGSWYLSERALVNGEDIRANALTHTLEYDPTINNTGSVLVSVGIKGVLS